MRRRRGQLPPLGSKPVGQFVQSILNTAPKDVRIGCCTACKGMLNSEEPAMDYGIDCT